MRVTAAIGGSVCVVLGLIGGADAAPPTRRALYLAGELAEVGLRRGYYPAANGREDASVMRLDLGGRS